MSFLKKLFGKNKSSRETEPPVPSPEPETVEESDEIEITCLNRKPTWARKKKPISRERLPVTDIRIRD